MQRTFPDSITDSCFVDVIDVTLAVEENKSKLVNEVAELMVRVVMVMIAFVTFPPFLVQILNISYAALGPNFHHFLVTPYCFKTF